MVEYNTIILGSGISGMSCAIYLKRAGLSVLMVEKSAPGGQLNKIGVIENYPGYATVEGPDLAMSLYQQVMDYEVDYVYEEILDIDYDAKVIRLENGEYHYQYLVFATGRRERLLELEHEKELVGHGISFCATCDGMLYKDKDVMVVGGGSSAVSEAIYLANICHKVYLVYRNRELRAEDILRRRVENRENVSIIYDEEISKYLYDEEKIYGVILKSGRQILVDCIFLAIGAIPNSELFTGKKENGYIVVDSEGKTDISDVYACGDVILKDVYQLVTASSEGVIVASSIIRSSNL